MAQPRFSKKTYVLVAQTIREAKDSKYDVAMRLAEKFQADNARFSFERFAKASGITF
jgi:hypothetical protein